jgi:hypothetical protein
LTSKPIVFREKQLFVLVWEFEFEGLLQLRMPQRDAEVMWNCSLSTSFNTVYERYPES